MNKYHIVLTEDTYYKIRELREQLIKENNNLRISYEDIIKELIDNTKEERR